MGQSEFTGLFNFFKCYRAVVRGKVEGFRLRDPDVTPDEHNAARENAAGYFQLAQQYARALAPPYLVVMCGPMGSGKSTLAGALQGMLDLELLSSDRTRKELAGIDPAEGRRVPFGADIYSARFSQRTYDRLHELAAACLRQGKSVLIDASYMNNRMRSLARSTARGENARFLMVYLDPGEGALMNRLQIRDRITGTVSDGREELLSAQLHAFEPPDEVPEEMKLAFGKSGTTESQVRSIYRRLLATN
jgi:hypothetical protein